MKTTLDLPDDLMRAVKIRAAQENQKLKHLVADLLRRGLAQPRESPETVLHRVTLPLIKSTHGAAADEELTPERVAEILLDEEAAAYGAPVR